MSVAPRTKSRGTEMQGLSPARANLPAVAMHFESVHPGIADRVVDRAEVGPALLLQPAIDEESPPPAMDDAVIERAKFPHARQAFGEFRNPSWRSTVPALTPETEVPKVRRGRYGEESMRCEILTYKISGEKSFPRS